jgi:hypothetical protein
MPSIPWQGALLAIQPRIRLTRSFDERTHTYLGYALRLDGTIGGQRREFLVGIGTGTQARHSFRAGDVLRGTSQPVADPRTEPVDLYKTVRLELLSRGAEKPPAPPPWVGVPPALPVYRERGHRRLAAQTYEAKCRTCLWGCRMPVDMIVDPWKPRDDVRYRFETFCYGPKSCPLYRAGPRRKVPGRKGVTGKRRTGWTGTLPSTGGRRSDTSGTWRCWGPPPHPALSPSRGRGGSTCRPGP